MNNIYLKAVLRAVPLLALFSTLHASERAANTVILDESGVLNLGIVTEEVDLRDFETTVFAIGRIEEVPARRSVLSTRVAGRVKQIHFFEGDTVK